MTVKELNGLKSAIEAAGSMKPAFSPPILTQANELVKKIEAEIACKSALLAAVASRNVTELGNAIQKANAIGLVCNELQQAVSLKARIEQEAALTAKLVEATKAKDGDKLSSLVSQAAELGITGGPEIDAANVILNQLGHEKKQKEALLAAQKKRDLAMKEADAKLSEAIQSGNHEKVNAVLNDAMQLGLATDTVKTAQLFLSAKGTRDEVQNQMEASIKVLKVKAESGVTEADLVPLRVAITKARQVNKKY
jgi:hypothetical protein